MASEWARRRAEKLAGGSHVKGCSEHQCNCGFAYEVGATATTLDEAYAAGCEDGEKAARSLAASLQESNTPEGHSCSCPWKCDYCDEREGERRCGK